MADTQDQFGRRATQSELSNWSWRLGGWATPIEFAAAVEAMADQLGDHAIDQAGSCFRDAWMGSQCARLRQSDGVRLGADPPDFELKFKEKIIRCEAVEVLAPGRKRGDELNAARQLSPAERSKSRGDPEEGWLSTEHALAQLTRRIIAKAAKGYDEDTVLAAYLNVGFVTDRRSLDEGLRQAIQIGFMSFSEIWILWGSKLKRFNP